VTLRAVERRASTGSSYYISANWSGNTAEKQVLDLLKRSGFAADKAETVFRGPKDLRAREKRPLKEKWKW